MKGHAVSVRVVGERGLTRASIFEERRSLRTAAADPRRDAGGVRVARSRLTVAVAVSAAVIAAASLAGCAADWTAPHPAPSLIVAADAGFLPPTPLAPAATMTPSPGSWVGARPTAGLRVVLLTMGDEAATVTMTDAVRTWAREVGADLREVRAGNDPIPAITQAIDMHADVVMSAGDALVDPLAIVTASHLDQPFLVLGGELAEPTQNVLAVDWAGAGFRGEDLGQAAHHDPASFTPERCSNAVAAGVAALLSGQNGVVVWIP